MENLSVSVVLTQDQLDCAVTEYIGKHIPINPESTVGITYIAGRRGNGTTATVVVGAAKTSVPSKAVTVKEPAIKAIELPAEVPGKAEKVVEEKAEVVEEEQAVESKAEAAPVIVETETTTTETVAEAPAKKSLFNS